MCGRGDGMRYQGEGGAASGWLGEGGAEGGGGGAV